MMTPRFVIGFLIVLMCLTACGSPTPTPLPPPSLSVDLNTDRNKYDVSNTDVGLTLVSGENQPVYLPVCGPWRVVEAVTLDWYLATVCEEDYLGYKVEPGEPFADNLQFKVEPGSYRVQVEVYGDCVLGEPRTISAKETYYGLPNTCGTRAVVYSNPFDIK